MIYTSLDRALDRALARAQDLALAQDLDLDRALAHDLDRVLVLDYRPKKPHLGGNIYPDIPMGIFTHILPIIPYYLLKKNLYIYYSNIQYNSFKFYFDVSFKLTHKML